MVPPPRAPLLALLLLLSAPPTAAQTVEEGETTCSLNCRHGGICRPGTPEFQDYSVLPQLNLTNVKWLAETNYGGEYCDCGVSHDGEGYAGVTCKHRYRVCPDGKMVCFHDALCVEYEAEGDGPGTWGCDCTTAMWQGERGYHAGRHCEYRASKVCAAKGKDGLEEGRWFCANRGKCQDDESAVLRKCSCADGWFGPHCEFHNSDPIAMDNYRPKDCTLGCRNGGTCVFGSKDYGDHVDKNQAAVPWAGEKHKGGMHCVCPDGYTGLVCQIAAEKCGRDLYCYNGAECKKALLEDGTPRRYCDCAEAATKDKSFAGIGCQHQSGTFCNPSSSVQRKGMSFCVNGGQCYEEDEADGTDVLGCECQDPWTGPHCEIHKEEEPAEFANEEMCTMECKNGGKCNKGVKDYGKLDKYDLDFESHQDFEHCLCPEGYTGLDCSVPVQFCPNSRQVCFYGSQCVATDQVDGKGRDVYMCHCEGASTSEGLPVEGRYCEHYATDLCNDAQIMDWHSFCTNGGTCKRNVGKDEPHAGCDCPERRTGEFCERKVRTSSPSAAVVGGSLGLWGRALWTAGLVWCLGLALMW